MPTPTPRRKRLRNRISCFAKKDATASFDADFTVEVQDHCRTVCIPYSYKDSWIDARNTARTKPLSLGRTELGRLVAATAGQISGTTLRIPTTDFHTASEMASLSSNRAALAELLYPVRLRQLTERCFHCGEGRAVDY